MVLYIRNVNELQSWGMMGELITRGVYGGNSVVKNKFRVHNMYTPKSTKLTV